MTRRELLLGSASLAALAILPIPTLDESGPATVSYWLPDRSGPAAQIACYDACLTDAEIADLAKGVSPSKVRPERLVYWEPAPRWQREPTEWRHDYARWPADHV